MGIADNDIIDNALDAAIAKLDEADGVKESPTQSEPDESNEIPVEEPTEDLPKVTKSRDDKGKFTKTKAEEPTPEANLKDQEANAELKEPEVQSEEPVTKEPLNPPAFWTAKQKALFEKADPALQETILERELFLQQQVSRQANEESRGKAFEKRLYEDMGNDPSKISTHRAELRLQGLRDEVEELHRYRAWNSVFKSNPKAAIADLMAKEGMTPQDFYQDNAAAQYPVDPRIEEALAEARAAKQLADDFKAQAEEQKQYQLKSEIDSFKQGKDSLGRVRKGFAELYAPQISQAVDAIQAKYPHLSLSDALTHAYEYVVSEASKAFGVNGSQKPIAPKPQEQVIADAKKAKAASTMAIGAPVTGSAPQRPRAKTIDEALDRAEEQLGFR